MLQRKNNTQPPSNKPNEKRKRRKIGEKRTHKSFLGQIKQRTAKPSKKASAFWVRRRRLKNTKKFNLSVVVLANHFAILMDRTNKLTVMLWSLRKNDAINETKRVR